MSSTYLIFFTINSLNIIIWLLSPFLLYWLYKFDPQKTKSILKFAIIYCFLSGCLILSIKSHISKNLLIDLFRVLNFIFWLILFFLYEKKINYLKSPFFLKINYVILISSICIFIGFYMENILTPFTEKYSNKTPNINIDKIYRIIKKYAPNPDDHLIHFGQNIEKYPMYIYLGKDNLNKTSSHFFVYVDKIPLNKKINYDLILLDDYLKKDLIENIKDPRYKMIIFSDDNFFAKLKSHGLKKFCNIDQIEYILRNKEIRDLINKNFEFIGVVNFIKDKINNNTSSFIYKNKKKSFTNDYIYYNKNHIFVRKEVK